MKEITRLFKYSIVGVSGTTIDIVTLFILVEFLSISVILGSVFAFLIAATNNFFLNKAWTFSNKNRNYQHQYVKFMMVSVVGLSITISLMWLFNSFLGIWYILAKLITSACVLIWNYLGNRCWTFKEVTKKAEKKGGYEFTYSIVIPAYNEEKIISKTINSIRQFFDQYKKSYEIIIVDDGSKDNTTERVSEIRDDTNITIVKLSKNQGKGYALRKGCELASGRYILMMDADYSTPITELKRLTNFIKDNDIVIGSRKMNRDSVKIKQPRHRRLISSVGSILVKIIISDIKDTQCGFKLIKNHVAKDIFEKQKIKRFSFDIEFLSIAQHYDYKIREVSVRWSDDNSSSFRPVRDTFRSFVDFIVIQYNFIRGKY